MEWIYGVSKSDIEAAGMKQAAITDILNLSGVSFCYSCPEGKAQEGRKSLAWREENIPLRVASEAHERKDEDTLLSEGTRFVRCISLCPIGPILE